ncbi:MAG: DUF4340 domain-containing protein [Opitutaceae bacterium]|nr:DUF4340 domain-containing protein [Opitutaceae bacterium]
MKLKTLALTVAILAILSAIAFLLQRPPAQTGQDPRVGQPILDAQVLNQATQVRLTDQGKTVQLTRQPDDRWLVPSYYDLPADFAKLSQFIGDLSAARVQRLVTRNPERLARLDFKNTSIALLDPAGKALQTLTLGKGVEGGGRFVRFDDEQKGYLANLSVFLDADAKNWTDSLLVNLKPDDITGIELTFAEGNPVVATRARKEDAWTAGKAPAGQRLKEDRLTSLLGTFTSLRFQNTSALDDPNVETARQHSRMVRLTTFDHQIITIQLGRKPGEKKETGDGRPEAGKLEAGGQPVASKPLGEGEKPETGSQKSGGGSQGATQAKPEPGPLAEASAKTETPNPGLSAATAASALAAQNSEPTAPPPVEPVYAFITSSDPAAPVNALMKKRAFQIYDWNYNSLPQKADELFEPVPALPAPEKTAETKLTEPLTATKPADEAKATVPEPAGESKPAQP